MFLAGLGEYLPTEKNIFFTDALFNESASTTISYSAKNLSVFSNPITIHDRKPREPAHTSAPEKRRLAHLSQRAPSAPSVIRPAFPGRKTFSKRPLHARDIRTRFFSYFGEARERKGRAWPAFPRPFRIPRKFGVRQSIGHGPPISGSRGPSRLNYPGETGKNANFLRHDSRSRCHW